MKQNHLVVIGNQQGAATLAVTAILLLLAGMITVYMANTSRKEQIISADQYRTEQSLDAALAGLDYALDYYNKNGLDELDADDDGYVDLTPLSIPDISSGDLVLTASAFFCDIRDAEFWTDPTACDREINLGEESYAKYIGIVATGWSDDHTARRVVTQLATDLSPFPDDDAPKGPMTTRGSVGFSGNVTLINRYYRDNLWSGGTVVLGESATVESFVAGSTIPEGSGKFSHPRGEMIAPGQGNTIPGVLPASSVKRGVNADVIDNDPILNTLSSDVDPQCDEEGNTYFFCAFLTVPNKTILKELAGNQVIEDDDCDGLYDYDEDGDGSPDIMSGIVYWDPTAEDAECSLSGNGSIDSDDGTVGTPDVGTPDEPVFLYIDGDAVLQGGAYYGFIYVRGDLRVKGNPVVLGSVLVEGTMTSETAAGAGTATFVYDPNSINPSDGFKNAKGPIEGTFRDFSTSN